MFINGFLITLMVKIWYSKRLFVLIIGCNNLLRNQNYSRKQTELSLFVNRSRVRVTDLLTDCMFPSPRGLLRMLRFSPFAEKQHLLCYLISLISTAWARQSSQQLLFFIRRHTAWPMASLFCTTRKLNWAGVSEWVLNWIGNSWLTIWV